MDHDALKSYADFLADGEQLHPTARGLCEALEGKGWLVRTRLAGRGLRYWCGCPKGHYIWLDTEVTTDSDRDHQLSYWQRHTCFGTEES